MQDINVSRSKNGSAKKHKGVNEPNLVPLIDVCLTLVIIFMVAYPLVMQSGINVSTPSMQKARTMNEETELKAEIHLREDNSIVLNGNVIESGVFSDSLRSLLSASKNKMVVISADPTVIHDQVVAILDEAKQCGAEQLSIVKIKR